MTSNNYINFEKNITALPEPILVFSTRVGKGNISIGNAICSLLTQNNKKVIHVQIEDYLPLSAVNEDLKRYKFIAQNFKFLLHIIYRTEFLYKRKYIREILLKKRSKYQKLNNLIDLHNAQTIIAISHRPCFWCSMLKQILRKNIYLVGVLTEFGSTIAWKHIAWKAVDSFYSPIPRKALNYDFKNDLVYVECALPIRDSFKKYGRNYPPGNKILIMNGFWGQISAKELRKIINNILNITTRPIQVICGENKDLEIRISRYFSNNFQVIVTGVENNIADIMADSIAVITKPGMATLLEANYLNRQIFLLDGMPVAEDNNAKYAIENFNAEIFSPKNFSSWLHTKFP